MRVADESKKEHPAAKAGRYVRAAGIVVGKEIDRRAADAAAKPAPPPPPPPPAPAPTGGVLGTTVFGFFVVALVVLGLTVLHFLDFIPAGERGLARVVAAAISFVEAFLLIFNWRGANERIGQRLLTRMWGHRGAMNRREKTVARIVRDVLALLGVAFLAAGVFQLGVLAFGE